MSEISDWIQSNWFELGSLLVQCALLATLAGFGSKLLRILATSHGQNEELRRLSLPNVGAEQPTSKQVFAAPEFESAGHDSGGVAAPWPGLIAWLQTPMGSGRIRSRSRVIRWLQDPIGS